MTSGVDKDRRLFLAGAAGLAADVALSGCGRVASSPEGQTAFETANEMSYAVQRAVMGTKALAPEFSLSDLSPDFRANGSIDPRIPDYKALAAAKFATWSMPVTGLVEKPRSFTLADLKALPRSQITRHDCVEGWSCIGQWKGPALSTVLDLVAPKPEARYVVFHCFDQLGADQTEGNPDLDDSNSLDGPPPKFYGSIDMADAADPQDHPRLRDERPPALSPMARRCGYASNASSAKRRQIYQQIEIVESLRSPAATAAIGKT